MIFELQWLGVCLRRYGCVLFYTPASEGIEYMDPSEFFKALSDEEISTFLKERKAPPSKTPAWKEKMARAGFKHEDWWLANKMRSHNRAHYFVFRFAVVGRSGMRSLVNGEALPVDASRDVKVET